MVESQKLKLLDFFVSHIYTTRASANSENKNIGGFKKIKEMLKIEKKVIMEIVSLLPGS